LIFISFKLVDSFEGWLRKGGATIRVFALKKIKSIKLEVLVADDNIMNQKIIKSLVEKLGHNCSVASNGMEAISQFEKNEYDVVFMDCRMPIIDGFEATKRIRQLELNSPLRNSSGIVRHAPIIALTADVMHGTREACLKVGMDDYLSKPVKRNAIEEILQALVDKKNNLMVQEKIVGNLPDEFEPGNNPTVLLVEDNEVNLKIGSVILKKHGFNVHIARGGEMAVELVTQNPKLYHVILMDMHMPGVDGQMATAQIREFEEQQTLPKTPIIALTADTTEGFRGLCLAAGCTEYMPKPIDYPLLIQLCKKFVNDRRLSV